MKGFGNANTNKKKILNSLANNSNYSSKGVDKVSKLSKDMILAKAFEFHSQGDIDDAINHYETFLNCGYKDPRVFSNYGVICQQKGDIQKAISLYKQSIKLYPNDSFSFLNLGTIIKQLGKLEESSQLFRRAIELNPTLDKAYLNLGGVLNDLKKFDEAEYYTREAIKLNPKYANAFFNLSSILHFKGKLKEAEINIRKAISLKPDHDNAYYNFASLLMDQNRLDEAETAYRKAIEINPKNVDYYYNLANNLRRKLNIVEAKNLFLKVIELNDRYFNAYNNLGEIYKSEGNFKKAEKYFLKAIDINPKSSKSYFSLTTLPLSINSNKWKINLFLDSLLNELSQKEKIDIYFSRSNVLHKEHKYDLSSHYLQLANDTKLKLYKSDADHLMKVSKDFLLKSISLKHCTRESINENIFIVGMPRSGSTLLESILSLNPLVYPLGEKNIFEESIISSKECSTINAYSELGNIYTKVVNEISNNSKILTNKWLFNYIYSGLILSHIPNAKIIHCKRNPLDNILSIYRAHFAQGNRYSSSLLDSTRLYLEQDRIMNEYKLRFPSLIYEFNYDHLVTSPKDQIKSLISWLNWDWNDYYLNPNFNTRFVSTASSVQVRSEINNYSVEGWRNYYNMLKPAMDILKTDLKYKNILDNSIFSQ